MELQKNTGSIGDVLLRDVLESDLLIFFQQQRDPDANHMAAFTVREPANREAFDARWVRFLRDETIKVYAILFEGHVAGHISKFEQSGESEITYWLGKEYWGKGIATMALSDFLRRIKERPLYARAAKDNLASLRVLEKCGFTICDYGRDFANARGKEIEEVILKLESASTGEAQ